MCRDTALDQDPRGTTAAIVFRHLAAAGGLTVASIGTVEGLLTEMKAAGGGEASCGRRR